MPLANRAFDPSRGQEKIAIIMNSSQVSAAKGDLARLGLATRLAFADGLLGPYKVVGRASLVAWSLQYSVMVRRTRETSIARRERVARPARAHDPVRCPLHDRRASSS